MADDESMSHSMGFTNGDPIHDDAKNFTKLYSIKKLFFFFMI